MKYEDMSDFKISCYVASTIYGVDKSEMNEIIYANKKSAPVWDDPINGLKSFDINNPSDVWSIIADNKIHIAFGSCYATAKLFTDTHEFQYINKNPLRAAMICFLMMKDAE